jgi:hypothetical protein
MRDDGPQPTALGNSMRKLAPGHSRELELLSAADAFELATDRLSGSGNWHASRDPSAYKRFLGAWAKARKIYTECAGIGIMED